MGMVVKRFDVYLVVLDPIVGVEIQKTRPCLVISPDEMNAYLQSVIVAPMTTKSHNYPSRVPCYFENADGYIVLDQIRTVDKGRLRKYLGRISESEQNEVLSVLMELFSP